MKAIAWPRSLQVAVYLVVILLPMVSHADSFIFRWWILSGDYDQTKLDLNGDPVPLKIWCAVGSVRNQEEEDFPLTTAWLEANYGSRDVPFVEFRFGTQDTTLIPAFELDPATFSNDPATGLARMTYKPVGGGTIPVAWFAGGEDADGGNRDEEPVATGTVSAIHLIQNRELGWSGCAEITLDLEEIGTTCPLYDEVAALEGGPGPSYDTDVVIGDFDIDPVAQAKWEAGAPSGQVADATVLLSRGLGYAGEPSGCDQDQAAVPENITGAWRFALKLLPELGTWFDPPLVSEYRYYSPDAKFTGVELPTGIDAIDGKFIILYSGKQAIVNEGVFYVFPAPVSEFRVIDIEPSVDAADNLAFPVRLALTTESPTVYIQPDRREEEEADLDALPSEFEMGQVVNLDLGFFDLLPGESLRVTGLPRGLVFMAGPPPVIAGTVLGFGAESGVQISVMRGRSVVRSYAFDLAVEPYRYSGSYELLIEDVTGTPLGKLKLVISNPTMANPTPLAPFSATLQRAGEPLRKSRGSFVAGTTPAVDVPVVFPSARTLATVDFEVTLTYGSDLVTGEEDAGSTNTARGFRLARTARIPGWSPRLTLALTPSSPGDRTTIPGGTGWAAGSLNSGAFATVRGQLGDAQPLTLGLNLSQTNQAVVWASPYRNTASYVGGILTIGNLGITGRGAPSETQPPGLKWFRGADPFAPSYRLGFPIQNLTGVVSRWNLPQTAEALALSLGLENRRIAVSYVAAPPDSILPVIWSLRDRYTLLAMAPSNSVAWRGGATRTTGAFGGNLTLAVPSARTTVAGTFLQDESFGTLVGLGVVRIPVAGPVRGSFETAGIRLEQ
jgi:hypothetical protein